MYIKSQKWEVNGIYLILYLNTPYFSAWQRFGWVEGTEGYSISKAAFEKARELKKKILVKNKYGDYEISVAKASKYLSCTFTAGNTLLICLPKSAFKKLPKIEEESIDLTLAMSKLIANHKAEWEELRNKLHK